MKKKMYLLCFVLVGILACNQQQTKTEVKNSTSSDSAIPAPSKTEATPTKSENIDAATLVQEKPLTEHAKQFYTNLLWRYEAAVVINNPEGGKEYVGKWVKFKPDNTLETSFYNGPINKGRWTIDEEKSILMIMESGERPRVSQWKVKSSSSSDAIMILIGTEKYANNATQIKMLRNSEIPVKEVQ